MRREFAELIYKMMSEEPGIVIVTADLGYGMWDRIKSTFPDRFYNVGAAEIFGLSFCVGLSYMGYKPIFYSITPFALWRPAEVIRNYLNHEKAKVLIALSGRGKDYTHDGFSHDASDAKKFAGMFKNIRYLEPVDANEMISMMTAKPFYAPAIISLKR